MNKFFYILMALSIAIIAHAHNKHPAALDGTYNMYLDRSKQTFNGHPVSTDRPYTQTEEFNTTCDKSECIAHSVNKRPPPKVFDYRWVNGHWESVPGQQHQFIICSDGSKVDSVKMDIIKPKGDGSFSGERTITVKGAGCPGDGPGTYWLPFTLTPIKLNHDKTE